MIDGPIPAAGCRRREMRDARREIELCRYVCASMSPPESERAGMKGSELREEPGHGPQLAAVAKLIVRFGALARSSRCCRCCCCCCCAVAASLAACPPPPPWCLSSLAGPRRISLLPSHLLLLSVAQSCAPSTTAATATFSPPPPPQ